MNESCRKPRRLAQGHKCVTRDGDKACACIKGSRILSDLREGVGVFEARDTAVDDKGGVDSISREEGSEFADCGPVSISRWDLCVQSRIGLTLRILLIQIRIDETKRAQVVFPQL